MSTLKGILILVGCVEDMDKGLRALRRNPRKRGKVDICLTRVGCKGLGDRGGRHIRSQEGSKEGSEGGGASHSDEDVAEPQEPCKTRVWKLAAQRRSKTPALLQMSQTMLREVVEITDARAM
eukprot:4893765-Amphidinium_carterae.1